MIISLSNSNLTNVSNFNRLSDVNDSTLDIPLVDVKPVTVKFIIRSVAIYLITNTIIIGCYFD